VISVQKLKRVLTQKMRVLIWIWTEV